MKTRNFFIKCSVKTFFIITFDVILSLVIILSICFFGCVNEETLSTGILFLALAVLFFSVSIAKVFGTFKRINMIFGQNYQPHR
jgi:hypothetical protein